MRFASLLLVLSFAGCASYDLPRAGTWTSPAQINVVVNADESLRAAVDVDHFEELTRAAMAKYAASAAPSTISVQLRSVKALPNQHVIYGSSYQHSVPSLSTTPWNDGMQPMVTGGGAAILARYGDVIEVVRGSYTISDAAGRIVEQRSFTMALNYDAPVGTLHDEAGTAARLAKRLAEVMRRASS